MQTSASKTERLLILILIQPRMGLSKFAKKNSQPLEKNQNKHRCERQALGCRRRERRRVRSFSAPAVRCRRCRRPVRGLARRALGLLCFARKVLFCCAFGLACARRRVAESVFQKYGCGDMNSERRGKGHALCWSPRAAEPVRSSIHFFSALQQS